MRTYFAFLATAALLVACSDSSRTPTAPSLATPKFDVTADGGETVYGWQGVDVGTAEVSANSAQTFRGFPCFVGPGGLTFDSHATISNSGNSDLYCKGQLPGDGPPKAIVLTGFLCFTFGGPTTDSHLVISPSGNVILQCHTKA